MKSRTTHVDIRLKFKMLAPNWSNKNALNETIELFVLSPNAWAYTKNSTPETATAAAYKFRLKVYPTSIWNICSIWLFYNEFECSSSRVTFHVKLSRYLINVQRTQLMLMDVQNWAVIKPLLGDGTSHIGFQSAQTWEAMLSLDTTGRRTSCSTWSNIDLTTDGIETSEATVYGFTGLHL
jgi:hypothetical protein